MRNFEFCPLKINELSRVYSNKKKKEFAAIKNRVKEMEEEAQKLKQLQTEMEQQMQLLNPQTSKFFYSRLFAYS